MQFLDRLYSVLYVVLELTLLCISFQGNNSRVVLLNVFNGSRAVTKALIGGGSAYSYIRVLPDEFLLKSTLMTTDFKRNSSGRTRIYEYSPPQLTL